MVAMGAFPVFGMADTVTEVTGVVRGAREARAIVGVKGGSGGYTESLDTKGTGVDRVSGAVGLKEAAIGESARESAGDVARESTGDVDKADGMTSSTI